MSTLEMVSNAKARYLFACKINSGVLIRDYLPVGTWSWWRLKYFPTDGLALVFPGDIVAQLLERVIKRQLSNSWDILVSLCIEQYCSFIVNTVATIKNNWLHKDAPFLPSIDLWQDGVDDIQPIQASPFQFRAQHLQFLVYHQYNRSKGLWIDLVVSSANPALPATCPRAYCVAFTSWRSI